MEQPTDIEPTHIEELLATFRELQAQFDTVRERLRRAEESRHTVHRRIYDRVRADYDRELDSIRARMTPVREQIDRMHDALETQWHDASTAVQSVDEELAEAEFRHRIGEFEPPAYDTMRADLDVRAGDARARLTRLETTLAAIASMRSPSAVDTLPESAETSAALAEADTVPVDAAAAAATAAAMPAAPAVPDAPAETDFAIEHEPSPRPVLNAAAAEAPRGVNGFENPHDWIAEMGPDAAHGGRRVRLTPPSAPAPATVAASVPSPAATASDEIDSVLSPVATADDTLPSLVFVSGPHAGQAIALLPTSLTIGREHDNNVEIKDPDVARYHARILRERDEYVVEDLSSSTGTWVNGKRVQRAVLTHGDVIRVGRTELALDFEWTMDTR